ncbi:MAG: hypothetical protein ACFFCI_05595, partial [Promethearchaeota archaeon]
MKEDKESNEDPFFEEIVKKTKTGITFPKIMRDEFFSEEEEVYFRLVIPKEQDKIILEILPEDKVKELS